MSYFKRSEISNSDLGWVEKYFSPQDQVNDIEAAYRFGTLVDAIITEPHRINFFSRSIVSEGDEKMYIYSSDEIRIAEAMKKSFCNHALCKHLLSLAEFQKIDVGTLITMEKHLTIELPFRCKWDLYMKAMGYGGDIKSTAATSQAQFESSIGYFNYDRQRAVYMDIADTDTDILIGISKVAPHKVFPVIIKRDDDLYTSGKRKYEDLMFKYWYLFEQFKIKN